MEIKNEVGEKEFIFGSVFMLANKLQVILDKDLAEYDLTAKQWFLTIIIASLFQSPPTLNEVADAIGNSHQNVKQVAMKLEQKGFLNIKSDDKDKRALRLELTPKCFAFWNSIQEHSQKVLDSIFEGVPNEELIVSRNVLNKVMSNIEEREEQSR